MKSKLNEFLAEARLNDVWAKNYSATFMTCDDDIQYHLKQVKKTKWVSLFCAAIVTMLIFGICKFSDNCVIKLPTTEGVIVVFTTILSMLWTAVYLIVRCCQSREVWEACEQYRDDKKILDQLEGWERNTDTVAEKLKSIARDLRVCERRKQKFAEARCRKKFANTHGAMRRFGLCDACWGPYFSEATFDLTGK